MCQKDQRNVKRNLEALQKIGRRIDNYRQEKKLSKHQLSKQSEIDRMHLNRIMNGEANLSVTTLIEIANGLGIPAALLLLDDKESKTFNAALNKKQTPED